MRLSLLAIIALFSASASSGQSAAPQPELPGLPAAVIIGGLISATLLTLFALPSLYARFGGSRSKAGVSTHRLQPE